MIDFLRLRNNKLAIEPPPTMKSVIIAKNTVVSQGSPSGWIKHDRDSSGGGSFDDSFDASFSVSLPKLLPPPSKAKDNCGRSVIPKVVLNEQPQSDMRMELAPAFFASDFLLQMSA